MFLCCIGLVLIPSELAIAVAWQAGNLKLDACQAIVLDEVDVLLGKLGVSDC